ncbi:MAG: hypothetical protein PF487_09075 [Bacteroidales bacterium]|jgi:queuine/archaeosine tRNA-ribosyltransferase|nr:hypothetical protein [Bacteroidales bacterium]
MVFSDLMKEVNSWIEDEIFLDHYSGDEVSIQKEFLNTIQYEIGSDFVILTKEELQDKLDSYYNSMEGF